jgi:hypothetical protein
MSLWTLYYGLLTLFYVMAQLMNCFVYYISIKEILSTGRVPNFCRFHSPLAECQKHCQENKNFHQETIPLHSFSAHSFSPTYTYCYAFHTLCCHILEKKKQKNRKKKKVKIMKVLSFQNIFHCIFLYITTTIVPGKKRTTLLIYKEKRKMSDLHYQSLSFYKVYLQGRNQLIIAAIRDKNLSHAVTGY